MPEKIGRPLDDEEAESEPAGAGCRAALKRQENALLLDFRYAGASIVHFDANRRAPPTASDKDTPACRGVVDRVAHQIAQYPTQQHELTRHKDMCCRDTKLDPLLPRPNAEFDGKLLENRVEPYRLEFGLARVLAQPQRLQQQLQLFRDLGCGALDARELPPFQLTSEPQVESVMRRHDDLQRLAQIVAEHRQQHRAEIASPWDKGSASLGNVGSAGIAAHEISGAGLGSNIDDDVIGREAERHALDASRLGGIAAVTGAAL